MRKLTIIFAVLVFSYGCESNVTMTPGFASEYIVRHEHFRMRFVPPAVFPSGEDDELEASVSRAFWLEETEVTNALVCSVFQWAFDNGKFSANPQDHNGIDEKAVKFGGNTLLNWDNDICQVRFSQGRFFVVGKHELYPVVAISWYGAVMFCNWLTEMTDGNAGQVVYTNIDATWLDGETAEDTGKKGFRLPMHPEWELAARYMDGVHWLPADHASGDASGPCHELGAEPCTKQLSVEFGNYAWYMGNSDRPPHSGLTDVRGTHPVASPGGNEAFTGTANQLGLYDMSGNVWEWTGTRYHLFWKIAGGNWSDTANYLCVGFWDIFHPTYSGSKTGLRLAKTP